MQSGTFHKLKLNKCCMVFFLGCQDGSRIPQDRQGEGKRQNIGYYGTVLEEMHLILLLFHCLSQI